MNRILIGIGVFVILLIAAVLIGPGLVDWNNYKADISNQVERLTGRKLTINGNIEVSVLPAPALIANDVQLSNVDGASAADMVRLKSFQVRVALGPLLGGDVKVQSVRLIEPVIDIQRFADGRTNLEMIIPKADSPTPAAPDGGTPTSSSPGGNAGGGTGAAFSLDNFVVENAQIIFRDDTTGNIERIDALNASFAAASLVGPFESTGRFVARDFPLAYTVSVGKIIEQRTAPLSLTINLEPGETKTTLTGAIVGLSETPRFKGQVKSTGTNLARLIQSLGSNEPLPGLLGQNFGVEGEIEASATATDIQNLVLTLGKVVAKGSATAEMSENISVDVDLAVDTIDVDGWLGLTEVGRTVVSQPVAKQAESKNGETTTTVTLELPAKVEAKKSAMGPVGIPTNIEAALNVSIDSLTVNKGLVRHARLSSELAGGEVTISQLSAQLPGSADVAVFGFIVPGEKMPQFDGELEVSVGDLRGVLSWLGIAAPPVPSDRLRKMTLVSKLLASPNKIAAKGLDMQFDSSRLTGSTLVTLGKRPLIETSLVLDRINLDAYLNGMSPAAPPSSSTEKPKPGPSASAAQEAGSDGQKVQTAQQFSALSALKDFDANIKGQINTLVYSGSQVKNVVLDTALLGGNINLKQFSIEKIAGSSVKASGGIGNLGGIPEMSGFKLDARVTDLSRLFQMVGAVAPVNSKNLGVITFTGALDGSVLNPLVNINLTGADASIAAQGKVSVLPIVGGFTGKVQVKHQDMEGLLKSLGIAYRPGGKLGGFDLNSDVKADMKALMLENLNGRVGPVKLNGTANVSLTGPRTKITTNLNTSKIDIDRFLPATKNAFYQDPATALPVSFVSPLRPNVQAGFKRQVAFAPGRWPTDPVDLSALKDFDADIAVKSEALSYGNYTLTNSDIAAVVNDGVLQVQKLTGQLFGGDVSATATVKAASPSTFETALNLKNLNVASGLKAVIGESPATGKAGMDIKLASSGYTVADIVAALAGNGSLALNSLDVSKGGNGTALSSALGLVAGLNSLGGALTGNKAGAGLADITGSFNIDQGIARSSDLKLVSSMGKGAAQGNVDLSRWLIDVAGQVEMSQNVLGLLLNKDQNVPSMLPFSIKGNLDAPNVKLDTSKLQGGGIAIPGLDKVLKKKGVGTILQQLVPGLGGSTGTPAQPASPPPPPPSTSGSGGATTPPPPPPPVQQEPQQMKPKDLLKGLLKGLGG